MVIVKHGKLEGKNGESEISDNRKDITKNLRSLLKAADIKYGLEETQVSQHVVSLDKKIKEMVSKLPKHLTLPLMTQELNGTQMDTLGNN